MIAKVICLSFCQTPAIMTEVMKDVYYDPASEGCFGGKNRLKQGVYNSSGPVLNDREVDQWLAGEDTYTLHKPARINYPRNRVMVYGIDEQFQADLVDMSMYEEFNDGYKFMLTCIDIFSKYAWCIPLKNKSGPVVTKAFASILAQGRKPMKLQTDRGGEFFNKFFSTLTSKEGIHHFATGSELKASVIERFNRTIKGHMWRYLTHINSKRYIEILQDLVKSYNNSYHRSIKMRPSEVCAKNEIDVYNNLYGEKPVKKQKTVFKYTVGDLVRISKTRGPFTKGYDENYTHEYFTITKCIARIPPVYKLEDYDGEPIEGSFYEQELQKIVVPSDKNFKVESILQRKGRGKKAMVFVKWLGWPQKFNSWVREEDVVDL